MADDDQALAAEPGFDGDPPQGGGAGMMSIRRFPDHRSEPMEQQPENGLALTSGLGQPLGRVMEDGASGATFKAAPGTVVEFMGDEFRGQRQVSGEPLGHLPVRAFVDVDGEAPISSVRPLE